MNAEEIATTLSIARSNVSTSLKELESWGIVRAVHLLGDRREHYQARRTFGRWPASFWTNASAGEIDPTVSVLRECLRELEGKGPAEAEKARAAEGNAGVCRDADFPL